jgi:hypothetical protein
MRVSTFLGLVAGVTLGTSILTKNLVLLLVGNVALLVGLGMALYDEGRK